MSVEELTQQNTIQYALYHCDTLFVGIESLGSWIQTNPRPSATQEPQVGGGCSWGFYRHVSEQYNSHKTHVEGPGPGVVHWLWVAGGFFLHRVKHELLPWPSPSKKEKRSYGLTILDLSRSNHHQYHQTTLLHVYHPKNKITQLPEICFFPFFSSPQQNNRFQVDSRRTWEVSKLITRNVEIARKGGVVPENLAPQPAPVAPAAPVPPPVKEESKPTGYPKTEAPPDPAPQEVETVETTVPSAGWIWGWFWWFWSMISRRWDGPVVYHNSFQRNNPPLCHAEVGCV